MTITRFLRALLLGALLLAAPVHGQAQTAAPARPFAGLVAQRTARLTVYATPGHEARARQMAELCTRAIGYLQQPALLGFAPRVTLLVLGPADWKKYARIQAYGMPHTVGDTILVVAAEDNAMWRGSVPPAKQLSPAQARQVQQVYRTADGSVSMMKFFDLTAVHELAHAFYRQARLGRPRYWLEELFANMLLHTFVATQEPALLPALELFPQVVVDGTDLKTLGYTSLADFEQQYESMPGTKPLNYGWYQCRLHRAAARIYQQQGAAALPALWRAFRQNSATYNDAQLAAFLHTQVGPELARVQTGW